MATTPPDSALRRFGRIPNRQAALLAELRDGITDGSFPPGSRLPTRADLQQRFSASCITVQRVVDRLAADGLIEARGPLGTFVVDHPPHLHRIALIFPHAPDSEGRWNSYYDALVRAANGLRQENILIDIQYDGGSSHNRESFARLQRECRDGLYAGLIFASPPEVWHGTPIADATLPRVSLSTCQQADAAIAYPDQGSFAERAAHFLAAQGCQRPAVICSNQISEGANPWHACFDAVDIPLRPQWLLGADLHYVTSASRLTRMLFTTWTNERPDALVIADDNFESAALAGMMAEGVRVGSDVQVVAHANFPLVAASAAPVTRLGFEVTALLRHAVTTIHASRAGKRMRNFALPATFADGT